MVSSEVEVVSKKAGETLAHRWVSDGKGEFTIDETARDKRGTTITLHLNEADAEYVEPERLLTIVKKYSDHVALPIVLEQDGKDETLNAASALWIRPKAEITTDQYKEFYHHVAHAFDEPWMTLHNKAEGTYEYTTLLFIPGSKPFDLFEPERKHHVKLYVRRVFITDDAQELLPPYLRFLRGVVDSEDLPLNVSREILQQNRILNAIRTASVKKVLAELKSIATDRPDEYKTFIDEYNRPMKEGLYGDFANREAILELIRVKSTKAEGWTSLADVKARMKEGQKGIYFITGGPAAVLRSSPLLEIYKKKDIEVLILDDEFDELVFGGVDKYQDVELKAVNKTSAGEDLKDEADKDKSEDIKPLLDKIKGVLGDRVKDVKASMRLADSPSCIVSDEDEPSMKMAQMLRAMGQDHQLPALKPTLEINPDHEIVKKLLGSTDDAMVNDAAWLLFDEALLVEGIPVENPGAFVQRLNRVLSKAV